MNSINAASIAKDLFSHKIFKDIDTAKLLATYDVTEILVELKKPIRSQSGQLQQTGFVISAIPPQGIVLSVPGSYSFAGNLTWNPTASGAAITITAPEVTLDMGGFTLTATVPDPSLHCVGIHVPALPGPPLIDIVVRNGVLAGLSLYGIQADAVVGLTIEGVTVSGIACDDLTVRNLCPAGIHVEASAQFAITNCTVTDLSVTTDSSAGIQLVNCHTGTVTGCAVTGLLNHDGSAQGYSYIGCLGIVTANCAATGLRTLFNGNTETIGHTAIGYCPIFCSALAFDHCSALDIIGCCDDAHGMSVFIDGFVTVNDFTARGVMDGAPPFNTGAKATGLEVYGVNVSLTNCSVDTIVAINPQDKQSAGFSAWGFGIGFTGCKATNVEVRDQDGKWAPDLGYGVGFGWAPDPRPEFCGIGAYFVTYADCQANQCQVGFDTWFHVDSVWSGVTAADCGQFILVQPGQQRTLTADACSECKPPITVTLTNIATGNLYPSS